MPQANHAVGRFFKIIGPFLGLLVVLGLFALSPTIRENFFSGQNFKTILLQTVIVAIGALGMTIIIVSGGIDLSVGSVVALSSVVCALVLERFAPPGDSGSAEVAKLGPSLIAAALAILTGVFVGAIIGAIISGFRMMPFIVTLGMMGVARGTAKWLADSKTVLAPENQLSQLMTPVHPEKFFPLPWGVWMTVILAVLTALLMHKTVFGRYIFAIGANENAARLSGIRIGLHKTIIYAVAGIFFGIAGLMLFTRLNEGDPTASVGLELDIIAAVVIGGASLTGGAGSVLGSMVGALIMAVLRSASNQIGWPTYVQEIIIGGIIVVAVAVDRLRYKGREA